MSEANATLGVCIDNSDFQAALERRKIYITVADADAARHGLLRVVDESGEDYLYPAARFVVVDLPAAVASAVLRAA